MNLFNYDPYDPLQDRDATANEGRLTVHNIISSYHGNYDLFAESVQNAMDAIHERWRSDGESGYAPRIIVIVDIQANTFAVIDNGVGISGKDCLKVFAPNYSLKSRLIAGGGKKLRGHKGVGATFLAYGFNRTEIASKDESGELFTGRLNGGRAWAAGSDDEVARPLLAQYTEESRDFAALDRGTLIRVQCGSGTHPAELRRYGTELESWIGNLRSETAIGMIPDVVEPGFAPDVRLRLIDTDGEEREDQVECRYLFPHEMGEPRDFLDMAHHEQSARSPDPDPRDRNKTGIYRTYTDEEIRAKFGIQQNLFTRDRTLWLYVFQSYSAKFFRDFDAQSLGRRLRPGVRLAADSMPIGVISGISSLSRYTYSQNTVHVLLHVDGAEPDIGRKGFSEEVEDLGQSLAKELIEGELQKWNGFLRSERGERRSEAALDDWKFESRKHENEFPLPSWPKVSLSITSVPEREQDVIALFHELLGARALLGYNVLSTSQHAKYDSLMRVQLHKEDVEKAMFRRGACEWGVVTHRAEMLAEDGIVELIEYKMSLLSLINDFRLGSKSFSHLRLVIAWSAGPDFDKHVEDFALNKLEFPRDIELRYYPGQTHELRSGRESGVLPVILLEDLFASVGRR